MESEVKFKSGIGGEVKPENLTEYLKVAAAAYGEIFCQSLHNAHYKGVNTIHIYNIIIYR